MWEQSSCGITVCSAAGSAGALRDHLRVWLAGLAWPVVQAADIVLAAHEAAGAAGGPFGAPVQTAAMLYTAGTARRLRVCVRGPGLRHRPPAPARVAAEPGTELAVVLMQALVQRVQIRSDPRAGTEVIMLSHPVQC